MEEGGSSRWIREIGNFENLEGTAESLYELLSYHL